MRSWQEDNLQNIQARISAGHGKNEPLGEEGWTLLHSAAENENLIAIEYLVAQGADLEARTTSGWTPLHFAVDIAIDGASQQMTPIDFTLVRRLVDMGARLDARNDENQTPRDVAAAYGADALRLFDEAVQDTQ